MYYSELVKKAMKISFEAHIGDHDKCGYPYFAHPLTVAMNFDDEAAVCVALLHDVVEDHPNQYSFAFFEKEGFPEEIVTALKILTKPKEADYLEYIKSVKTNELARRVKLADLKHNMDLSRGLVPPKYPLYLKAVEILEK